MDASPMVMSMHNEQSIFLVLVPGNWEIIRPKLEMVHSGPAVVEYPELLRSTTRLSLGSPRLRISGQCSAVQCSGVYCSVG